MARDVYFFRLISAALAPAARATRLSRPTAYARRRVVAALVGFHAFGNLRCSGNPSTARAASASKRSRTSARAPRGNSSPCARFHSANTPRASATYASTVRSASLHPRRRRLIVSARDRRGMGRVGGRGSGRVAVSRAARRASSGAVDRPRGFVRNETRVLKPLTHAPRPSGGVCAGANSAFLRSFVRSEVLRDVEDTLRMST